MKKLSQEEYLKRVINKHNGKYLYGKDFHYHGLSYDVSVICPIHGEFTINAKRHLRGQGCKECGYLKTQQANKNRNEIARETFIERCKDVHGNNFTYEKARYIDNKHKVIVTCVKHGYFEIYPRHLLNGSGCKECAIEKQRKSFEKFKEDALYVHGTKYTYIKGTYLKSDENMTIICPIHGKFNQTPNSHLQGCGCPMCNQSHMETEVSLFLSRHNITYIYQKKFDWLGKQSLDFYLPKYSIAIECQGIQHFQPKSFGEKDKNAINEKFEKQKVNDIKKYTLCNKHNVKLIYINHNDSVNTILSKYFT